MIVQRTLLGPGGKWAGPWRIRVNTEASGTSNLTVQNYMHSANKHPILTDWGDGTRTLSTYIDSHTYAEPGDYIISHYSSDNFQTALLRNGSHKTIVEVLDVFPRLPAVGDGYASTFDSDTYLQAVPSGLFDNNSDYITNLGDTFTHIDGASFHIPSGLFNHLSNLINIHDLFAYSHIDYIPDDLFKGNTTITNASNTFESIKASYAGSRIFMGCIGLKDVDYTFRHADIESLGDDTFNGCTSIDGSWFTYTTYDIKAKRIGARTFANCTSIDSCYYNISGTITSSTDSYLESLGDYTWQNCTALVRTDYFLYNVPKLTTIPSHIFSGCTSLNALSYVCYKDAPSLGAINLYIDNCISMYSPAFTGVSDMTATTQRIIHIPSRCSVTNNFPKKYTVVADN